MLGITKSKRTYNIGCTFGDMNVCVKISILERRNWNSVRIKMKETLSIRKLMS